MDRRTMDAIAQGGIKHTTKVPQQVNTMICEVCPRYRDIIRMFLTEMEPIFVGLSDFQRICLIYQLVTSEVAYDYSLKGSLSYSFLGPFKLGSGVCEGISELFFLLANKLTSSTCTVYLVCGVTRRGETLHQWNVVKFSADELAGKAFHLDPTWDLGRKQDPMWFLLSDDAVKRMWSRKNYPVANQTFRGAIYRNESKMSELGECLKRARAKF